MARRQEGFKLSIDPRTSVYLVRFTCGGRPYKRSTGERDLGRATRAATRIYTQIVGGTGAAEPARATEARGKSRAAGRKADKAAPSTARPPTLIPLDKLFAEWLADAEVLLDETTVEIYTGYARARWLTTFTSLEGVNSAAVDAYVRVRLRQVKRKTILKELSALRGFVEWCRMQGHLTEVPRLSSPPRSALGVPYQGGRCKKVRVELTEAEVDLVLANLPERTRSGLAVKAYFTTMYETTLRRETLFSITAPGDYAKGRETLKIREEVDKARFGREVPLSGRARAALDSVCPKEGLIFPPAYYRHALLAAAKAAGLSEERAHHLSYHDFRHASLTHMASDSTDLVGMAFLAGHKHITTTAQYVHSHQKAAERALEARERRRS